MQSDSSAQANKPLPREKSEQRTHFERFLSSINTVFPVRDLQSDELTGLDPDAPDFKTRLADIVTSQEPMAKMVSLSRAASAFLYRKTLKLPVDLRQAEADFIADMGKPREPAGTRWFTVAEEVVDVLFFKDWDESYAKYAAMCRANNTSTLDPSERSAREVVERELTEGEFYDAVVNGEGLRALDPRRRVVGIDDGGKARVVTVADVFQAELLPLHLTFYDHLCKFRWMLRGEASASRLQRSAEGVQTRKGHVFVSGDYEGATNNFVPRNSTSLLWLLEKNSRHVPPEVWELAHGRFAEGELFTVDQQGRVRMSGVRRTGQLMGDYLSFPLLCLTNFIGVIYALGSEGWELAESGFLLINGDDICFYCSRESAERWARSVNECGLKLSLGKTLFHRSFVSVNSTFFVGSSRARGGVRSGVRNMHITKVPIVRWSTVIGKCKKENSGLYGRLQRIRFDGADKGDACVKLALSAWYMRTKHRGLPAELGRAIIEMDLHRGMYPREWKARIDWAKVNMSFVNALTATREEQGMDDLELWRVGVRRVVNTLKPSQGARAGGHLRSSAVLSASWGVVGLEKPSRKESGNTAWAHCIPHDVSISSSQKLALTYRNRGFNDVPNQYDSQDLKAPIVVTDYVGGQGIGMKKQDVQEVLVPEGKDWGVVKEPVFVRKGIIL